MASSRCEGKMSHYFVSTFARGRQYSKASVNLHMGRLASLHSIYRVLVRHPRILTRRDKSVA